MLKLQYFSKKLCTKIKRKVKYCWCKFALLKTNKLITTLIEFGTIKYCVKTQACNAQLNTKNVKQGICKQKKTLEFNKVVNSLVCYKKSN